MRVPDVLKFLIAGLAVCGLPAQAADLRVEYVSAREEALQMDIQLTGTIEALDSIALGFRQSGRVVEVLAEEGDHFQTGEPLARLDSVQQDQALKVAQANLAAARAAQAQARQADERARAMLERGGGPRAARDAAAQALSEADGSVRRAESAVDQASRAVDETVLRAPQPVVVTSRDIAPGQVVGAAQPAFSLATLNGLEAVFQAADHPLLREAMGLTVELTTIDFNRQQMSGTITEIAPLVDPQTGTVTVRALIGEVGSDVSLLGAAVRGHLRMSAEPGVVLPWTALMRHGDTSAVWVVDDEDRVHLTPVRIDRFADGIVYVSDGVAAGQTVVGAGSQLLYPGRKVQPAGVSP